MKNLINKVRHHGKKITIYLKSQPKWIARCMFGIGAIFGLVLSLHARTIGGTNAENIECPAEQQLVTGNVCVTNEKDIVIQATATEGNQTLTINKYFANDYTVDRGDGITGDLTANTTHTYSATGTYNIALSLSGIDRWTFTNRNNPLVPISGTTVTGVQVAYMPSLAEGFGDSSEEPGDYFFYSFNGDGALTSLPDGSFDTSNITTAGNNFFAGFNFSGILTSLPDGSFDTSKITTVAGGFFSSFNHNGALTHLPDGSFDTSNITTAGNNFFAGFNSYGNLTSLPIGSFGISSISGLVGSSFFHCFNLHGELESLPDGSFDTSHITTAGESFFTYFNSYGKLTSLPEGSFNISNITTAGEVFFESFNSNGALTSLPEGSFDISNITAADNLFFGSFNSNGALTSLPEGSFDTSHITTVSGWFFYCFNCSGALISLPEGSFNTSQITTTENDFFARFNLRGALTNLPEGSFDTSNITTAGILFFENFNWNGQLTSLPSSFTMSSVGSSVTGGYDHAFNSPDYTLNKNVSDLVAGISKPGSNRITFSDNQPGRCGVDSYWLYNRMDACSITYNSNGGNEITSPTKKYPTNTTGVAAGDEIAAPTRNGYIFSGWYTDAEGGNLVETVIFPDMDGNILYAQWEKSNYPTCNIEYSTTGLTNQNVTATLICDEDVTVTNNSGSAYTFENTGTFLFEFQYGDGNTGEELAEVTWIDKVKPTCNVAYDTTGATTGNVIASLTGCSGTITGTDLQHTFTGNGTYTFEFQDLAGNTGSTGAEVTWIISGNSTVYFDIERNEFNWDELTVCNPYDSRSCITMMDRNLGATTNDISKTGSYGFYYQWGNNYGFLPNLESLRTGEYQVDASSYGPGNYYNSGVYNVLPRNTVYARDRSTVRNNNLWGGSGDDLDNNYLGYPVRNPTDRQGPCPDGYHVPSMGERLKVVEWWALYTNGAGYGDFLINTFSKPGLSGGILKFRSDFYIPESKSFYTNRYEYEDFYDVQESLNFLRSSSPIPYTSGDYTEFGFVPHNIDNRSSRILYLDSLRSYGAGEGRNLAAPLRCFKNNTGYNQVDNGIRFSISIDNNIKTGEFTTFTVKVLKNGAFYSDYTGTILFTLTNNNGGLVNKKSYTIYNSGHYTFEAADGGRKVFYSGLKITEAGTYILEIKGLENGGIGSGLISVGKKHNSFDFKYNTLSFNPNYSDEMNEAYQYARYYTITTKDNIKEADMYGGLNRIAMAKMLVNYAENVLGINNYNTGRNCKFADVSTGLDKEYYYGVTKACQLGIMGVNMPNNKFYPNGGVTRAEFATALSRLLYGTPDGVGKYYSTHLVKLYQEKIITNTDPTLRELRGYVMLMLMRSDKK